MLLGIDVGGTSVKYATCDEKGHLYDKGNGINLRILTSIKLLLFLVSWNNVGINLSLNFNSKKSA